MREPSRRAEWGSRALATLAAFAVVAALVLAYADRTVFSADGFADRAAATLESGTVGAALARRATAAAIAARPSLVAVRPVLDASAEAVIRSGAFRSLVRGAARDLHRAAFARDTDTLTLRVANVGLLVARAVRARRPDLARRIPAGFTTRVRVVAGGAQATALRVAEQAEAVRAGVPIAFAVALLLALGALAVTPRRRHALLRLGVAVAIACGLLGLVAAVGPRAATNGVAGPDRAAVRAALDVWLGPLSTWGWLAAGAGAVLALAALAGIRPAAPGWSAHRRRAPRPARLAAVAAVGLAVLVAVEAVVADDGLNVPRAGRCNGHAALCDRPLNEVAFVATHNAMSADGEPGWLFAAQEAGIGPQLDDGVRALLIDTHYGFATPRGVATDLSGGTVARSKIEDNVGPAFVHVAKRLRARIGFHGGEQRQVFLCHGFCEVGATKALTALTTVHRFLVTHPEEVVVLSIEDATTPADTVDVLRRSGLADEVYRGAVRPPWPTLREMIDRDERVLVLTENHDGIVPWVHRQSAVAQETPYHFGTVGALEARGSCAANRGGTAGSLFLVNHWVDTTPAPRPGNAARVNARAFLEARLSRCRRDRNAFPNLVAVDFYREGDVFGVVDALNRVG